VASDACAAAAAGCQMTSPMQPHRDAVPPLSAELQREVTVLSLMPGATR